MAKSHSRVARPARGEVKDRGVLKQYVEGLSDEPAGLVTPKVARLVAAADLRFRLDRQALLNLVAFANRIAKKGRASPRTSCQINR